MPAISVGTKPCHMFCGAAWCPTVGSQEDLRTGGCWRRSSAFKCSTSNLPVRLGVSAQVLAPQNQSPLTSNLLTDGDDVCDSQLTAIDTAHGRPLPFILNRARDNLGSVLDSRQAHTVTLSPLQQKCSAFVEVDIEFEEIEVLG